MTIENPSNYSVIVERLSAYATLIVPFIFNIQRLFHPDTLFLRACCPQPSILLHRRLARSNVDAENWYGGLPSRQEKYVNPSAIQRKVPIGVQVPSILPSMFPSTHVVPVGTEPIDMYFVELVRRGTQSEYEI